MHGIDGVKWIQKPDGRVIEYYVYGSEEPDAKIFIQLCGDMSSASTFPQFTSFIKILKEKNVNRSVFITACGGWG